MWSLRRKGQPESAGNTALAEPVGAAAPTLDELLSEIDELIAAEHAGADIQRERRILELRNLAGVTRLLDAHDLPAHPEPEFDRLPEGHPLPEIAAGEVTPGLLRAGILRDGCLLVRGLLDRDAALAFAARIDRAFTERDRHDAGEPHDESLYSEFAPDPRFGLTLVPRAWIKAGGGVLAADSPRLAVEMIELFRGARLPDLVHAYLGEAPLISVEKSTLRKASPEVPGGWHQDGKFMGDVRALNLWVSLSRCGDEAPGLDIVPRRLDEHVLTNTDEAHLDYMVSQRMAEEAAGDKGVVRPIFEPGDAVLFDELMLHKTGSDPSMPKPRFAIENWFFGASAFPADYAPLSI